MVTSLRGITKILIIAAFTLLFIVSSYANINPKNIVASFLFNGDAQDSSGNGKNGQVKGGVKWVDGKFGKAIELNGTDVWVEIPALGKFDTLTIAEWVNVTGRVGQWRVIITNNGWKAGDVHHQLYAENVIGFSIHSNLGGNDSKSSFAFDNNQLNKWHHLATVYDDKNAWVRFYVDGKLDKENKWGGNPAVLDSARIGSWDGGGREWQGMFDDFVVLSIALEEKDIQDLMDKGVQSGQGVDPANKLAVSWGSVKNR
jgi:hypothetical protein